MPPQEAVARGFELELQRLGEPECYFESLPRELLSKRDFMAKFLSEVGMVPTIPEGGYFMIADWTSLAGRVRLEEETDKNKDYRFTKWMTKNVKLQGIPPSAFYGSEHANLGENYVRYCFIKEAVLCVSSLVSSDRMKPRWREWAVTIEFCPVAAM
uniref:Uncharacterized protein n=1 Tax=Timema douglasi TaxID=61478 RepID=A0A7R8ZG97_TIMDO|nr:unnamed protein product [Timema douglasi]